MDNIILEVSEHETTESTADDSKIPVDVSGSTRSTDCSQPTLSFSKRSIILFATACLNAIGVVYGDIGTSPLYTLRAMFDTTPNSDEAKGKYYYNTISLTRNDEPI
jgi:hypothetical protein